MNATRMFNAGKLCIRADVQVATAPKAWGVGIEEIPALAGQVATPTPGCSLGKSVYRPCRESVSMLLISNEGESWNTDGVNVRT